MSDEEQPKFLEDVDPSKLGQLSPGYTPYNPELQSWNRGRVIGGDGKNYQRDQASGQPVVTDHQYEDLHEAAKEATVHLTQAELDSIEQEKFSERKREATKQQNKQPERETSLENERNRQQEKDHER